MEVQVVTRRHVSVAGKRKRKPDAGDLLQWIGAGGVWGGGGCQLVQDVAESGVNAVGEDVFGAQVRGRSVFAAV